MYIIARTGKGRPTLMHKLSFSGTHTVCGQYILQWSRAYMTQPIPAILCKKCEKVI